MTLPFPQPRHVSCSECGAAVERAHADAHECEPERLLDFRMFQLRDEVASFDDEVTAYLDSPLGRFELWHAERTRRGGPACEA
jgi:hypothetical protein